MAKSTLRRTEFAVLTARFQRQLLEARLAACGGNACRAADSLGIHRNTFSRLMNRVEGLSAREIRRRAGQLQRGWRPMVADAPPEGVL